jgi:hypothetical protein
MRKLYFLISALLISSVLLAQSNKNKTGTRQITEHSNVIKIGANTFFDTDEFPFYINWETKIGERESLQFGVLPRIQTNNDNRTSGAGFSVAFRKYISKNRGGINGLFVSPVIKAGFLKDNYSYTSYYYTGTPPQPQFYTYQNNRKINQYNIAVVFGHKWAYKSGFSFETSGGFGYYRTTEKVHQSNINNGTGNSGDYTYINSGILPQLQINFGYAF